MNAIHARSQLRYSPIALESQFYRPAANIAVLPCGAVAQLGARVNGIHEVAGSIPASSTNSDNSVALSRLGRARCRGLVDRGFLHAATTAQHLGQRAVGVALVRGQLQRRAQTRLRGHELP